ncbi:hypothetical protein UFOVP961_73 [uncultured Caudovirales phage]|uniref:Uncharacterized protein n=1 Tax=uncultured Caudovirales phage TaxID=2100421 RepID=A0A6J5PZX3_9CAUD|nr:hypothetical protein UFOVP961_73 [uncultured Caudovirales phage]CAB4185044.1 hypothetical protein UFOVP1123_1 [uncultured Caudovirales phage]CAB4193014.1 hypothetical protein UFOVP1239_8 [uncultured Caudovirales phage]CAB4215761.1 hypothetical protein UFOVP1484_5 [uncultured Caudovirales phage]CAB5230514.1 hypothetical protein UFOVP1577_11 [uncultured Caudovirales phage]
MDIVTALISGSLEYKEDGTQINHPPTALALRAGNIIKTLEAQNQNNQMMIQQLQIRENSHLEDIQQLQQLLKECNEKVKEPVSIPTP